MKTKVTIGILAALILAAAAQAQMTHYHSWVKKHEVQGTNSMGNSIKICTWECGFGNNKHQTTTSGSMICPYPI